MRGLRLLAHVDALVLAAGLRVLELHQALRAPPNTHRPLGYTHTSAAQIHTHDRRSGRNTHQPFRVLALQSVLPSLHLLSYQQWLPSPSYGLACNSEGITETDIIYQIIIIYLLLSN